MSNEAKIKAFENLWGTYIEKVERLQELRRLGRYGYQLRQPKKSLGLARDALRQWCQANGEVSPV